MTNDDELPELLTAQQLAAFHGIRVNLIFPSIAYHQLPCSYPDLLPGRVAWKRSEVLQFIRCGKVPYGSRHARRPR
ncbi:MAG TPA: hypothetical protein VHD36_12035 [Pirellulales bacterium]|nr:hypothetical protein [Pirellulales bacterium]